MMRLTNAGALSIGQSGSDILAATLSIGSGTINYNGVIGNNGIDIHGAFTNPLSSGGAHAVRDESLYSVPSGTGGYASFDANPHMTGALAYDHFYGYQSRQAYEGSNTLGLMAALVSYPIVSSGTVAKVYGVRVTDATGAGAVTDQIGIYIDPLTKGSNSNYAIYAGGTAPVYLGGSLQMGGNIFTAGIQSPGGGGGSTLTLYRSNGTTAGIIVDNTGVGVGENAPSVNFDVNTSATNRFRVNAASGYTTPTDFSAGNILASFSRASDGGAVHGIFSYESTGGLSNLAMTVRNDMVFLTGNGIGAATERLRLLSAGNVLIPGSVGIGNISPSQKLHVTGGFSAGLNRVLQLSGGGTAAGDGPSMVYHQAWGNGTSYPTWMVAETGGYYFGGWAGKFVVKTNFGASATDVQNVADFSSVGINVPTGLGYRINDTEMLVASTTLGAVGIGQSGAASYTGNGNIGIGYNLKGSGTKSGYKNMAMGEFALLVVNTGAQNAAIGQAALQQITSGNNNVAIGQSAGYNLTSPNSGNTFIGQGADVDSTLISSSTMQNSSALGYQTIVTKSNQVVIGNSSVTETVLRGNVIVSSITGTYGDIGFPYITASSTNTQTIASATTVYPVTFDIIESSSNVTWANTAKSTFTISYAGTYLITYSAIWDLTGGENADCEIWLRVNNVDVPRTNTILHIINASVEQLSTVTYLQKFNANDNVQLMMRSASTSAQLLYTAAGTSPTRPESPSIIITINKISK